MRFCAVLFITVVLTACNRAPVPRSDSKAVSAPDSALQFLLTAAATDFHTHRQPDPAGFRNVRFGYVLAPSGERTYMLCGQFLPAEEGGKAQWTSFATLKTSDYEQWIGAQAESFCQNPSAIWDTASTLSAQLQSRFESLR